MMMKTMVTIIIKTEAMIKMVMIFIINRTMTTIMK